MKVHEGMKKGRKGRTVLDRRSGWTLSLSGRPKAWSHAWPSGSSAVPRRPFGSQSSSAPSRSLRSGSWSVTSSARVGRPP